MGKVIAIHISTGKHQPRMSLNNVQCIEGFGLEGDAYGGRDDKQVSFMSVETIEKVGACCVDSPRPGSFKENITTFDIDLAKYPTGTQLQVGESVHEITKIGKTCYMFCGIDNGEEKCPIPMQTVFTKVVQSGRLKEGDSIEFISQPSE